MKSTKRVKIFYPYCPSVSFNTRLFFHQESALLKCSLRKKPKRKKTKRNDLFTYKEDNLSEHFPVPKKNPMGIIRFFFSLRGRIDERGTLVFPCQSRFRNLLYLVDNQLNGSEGSLKSGPRAGKMGLEIASFQSATDGSKNFYQVVPYR